MAMFSGIDILLAVRPFEHALRRLLRRAASGVTSSYDALIEYLGNFLKRLEIYLTIPPSTMTDIMVKIEVEVE
jgi:hypothetical protein